MSADGSPHRVGRYELRRELGRGTMGVVHEAWDPVLGRRIALKTIAPTLARSSPDPGAYERRFLSEARAAARLSHPGIVVVHDVARDEATGLLYMALEFLVGETLEARLEGGALPWREALRIVGRVADALHHAHSQGVVHRDVKPANIMLLPSGEPKIMDFGVARVDATKLTSPGELFGTPLFMAPEQALGEPVDARTDLFSLGSVLYVALTGQPPFAATNVPGVLARIAHRDPRPPAQWVPDLPPETDYLVARAMAKVPAARYPDGRTLAEDIEDVLFGRPPRHRGEWAPPPAAAQTIASAAATAGAGDVPLLDLAEPPRQAPPTSAPPEPVARPRRRRAMPWLFLLLLAATGAHFAVYPADWEFWRREGPPLARKAARYVDRLTAPGDSPAPPLPATHATRPPPPPSEVAAREVSNAAAAEPSPAVAEAGPPNTPTESPAPPASPIPAEASPVPTEVLPAAPPAPAPTPVEPAPAPGHTGRQGRLVVEVEHALASGTLELWVDGSRVLREPLHENARRKPLDFSAQRGGAPQALAVRPGRHAIEVRVRVGEARRIARSAAVFKAGASRRLQVRVDRRGTPTLAWK